MFRKVYEAKFPDGATATKAIDKAGWEYAGLKGFFSKYHLYNGGEVVPVSDDLRFRKFELRLFDNGKVEFYVEKASGVTSMGLPRRVWPSLDIYVLQQELVNEVNRELGDGLLLVDRGFKDYRLYRMIPHPAGFGLTEQEPELAVFEHPKHALNWVAENLAPAS